MASHPEQALAENGTVTLDDKRSHYLAKVLRCKEGDSVALFNGQHGEWLAVIDAIGKKEITLGIRKQLRPQISSPDLWLLCAPLKNSKTEWVVEKATELGVQRISCVTTQFTVVDRINETRLTAIGTEAAEQCERMDVPVIDSLVSLTKLLGSWPKERTLIYGDESGLAAQANEVLGTLPHGSYAVLIGPEGGFSATELDLLRSLPAARGMCMGPRILRADTAAIAALTLLQAWVGDWQNKPAFRGQ
jgi:16S rRNA (uracil1498-N3)-methyltransferase